MDSFEKTGIRWALLIILIVAAGLRLYELNWDEGQHAHPDERWIAMVAPTITWPDDGADLFDPRRSTLNPLWVPDGQGGGQVRNFAYGHFPLYLHSLFGHTLAALGKSLTKLGSNYQDTAYDLQSLGEYGGITLVGRILSVFCDLGTIYLVYLLGKRIYDQRVGLLGAALVAFAVSHIQLSHFATFDVMTTFFITLSVYGSVCVIQAKRENLWPTLWAGAAAGLAVASKFSAAPLVLVLIVAQIIRAARHRDQQARGATRHVLQDAVPHILISLCVTLLAFFVASPFAIIDFKLYLKQIVDQGGMVRGTADWPFTRQYRNTTPFLYQITQQVRWGLGWPLGIIAFAGFGWTVLRQFRRPWMEEWILLGWALPYFILTGSFMVKFMRYMLPLLPLFILMGAAMVEQISKWANSKLQMADGDKGIGDRVRFAIHQLLSVIPHLVLLAALLWSLAFMWMYAQEHPWIQASKWIYQNVPDGTIIAVEHWDDHLPLSLPIDYANPGAHSYRHVELPMYEPDNYDKYDLIRSRLREADYIILSTNRLYRTIPRLPERYPISTEFYRLLFAGELGFARVAEFTAYPGLFGIEIVDDDADESFTVYDHPKPVVFRRERDLGDLEWDQLFANALVTPPVLEQERDPEFALFDRPEPEEGQEERTLLLDVPVGELPVVADFGWN
ncbi:MAG: phospholipid carrier-dependent glycosyltransferase, partial [Anaerolineae bacterium]|nr:phospholipid carrier-dependent glycosyltransferase [Anaerolineae bacterium]